MRKIIKILFIESFLFVLLGLSGIKNNINATCIPYDCEIQEDCGGGEHCRANCCVEWVPPPEPPPDDDPIIPPPPGDDDDPPPPSDEPKDDNTNVFLLKGDSDISIYDDRVARPPFELLYDYGCSYYGVYYGVHYIENLTFQVFLPDSGTTSNYLYNTRCAREDWWGGFYTPATLVKTGGDNIYPIEFTFNLPSGWKINKATVQYRLTGESCTILEDNKIRCWWKSYLIPDSSIGMDVHVWVDEEITGPNLCQISGSHNLFIDSGVGPVPMEYNSDLTTFLYYPDGNIQSSLGVPPYSFADLPPGNYSLTQSLTNTYLKREGYTFGDTVCSDPDTCDFDGVGPTVIIPLIDESGCGEEVNWYYSINDTQPWWQTGEGDVVATEGDISSNVPLVCELYGCHPAMSLFRGDESSAGVMMCSDYGSSISSGEGYISMDIDDTNSTPNWNAQADLTKLNGMNYDFFSRKLDPGDFHPLDEESLTCKDYLYDFLGYYGDGDSPVIYKVSNSIGELDIGDLASTCDIGENKIIVLFDGDVNIKGNIIIEDGKGFFMIVAGRDINIDPSVVYTGSPTYSEIDPPNIEGILFAEGKVNTGTNGGEGLDGPLYIRGMVAGISGIEMERSLENNNAGAGQYFKFAPDLLFNYPRILTSKKTVWREVAP